MRSALVLTVYVACCPARLSAGVLAGHRRWRPGAAHHVLAGARLLDRFRESAPDRFFAGVSREWPLSFVSDHLPLIRDDATSVADAVCAGRFDLLGYRDISFGDPPDWHLDPVSTRRAPFIHWSRLDPLNPAEVGDSKVVWELNRHQSLVRLGQAYWLTADERFVTSFIEQATSWMDANPPKLGVNWASSLEVAFRAISWTMSPSESTRTK